MYRCEKTKNTIEDLLKNNAERLNKIKKSQANYNNPNAARDITNFILSILKND